MRLFLALTPPPEFRQRLGALADRLQAELGGRRMPDANLHLTLAFLGEQDSETSERLTTWLHNLEVFPSSLELDHLGQFTRPGIVWIGPQHPPDALLELRAGLSRTLSSMGIAHQPHHRFTPHISLLRKVHSPVLQDTRLPEDDLRWHYDQVHLVQSTLTSAGSHYQCLASSTLSRR
uniref:RNA 2',3'-cyclic phosphodiesterase n=1 Tax=Halomonas sp. TaxID=1486246 RepID=UPI002623A7CE|nr:RNA 2',3'-cyclic phosphodiesterase [Halomonas sp.]